MRIEDLETPAVLIDLDIVEANIVRMQALMDAFGFTFRPHVKTHKLPELAELQQYSGARGIAVQKISEAEVFAAHGFSDILMCTTLFSSGKIARARRLSEAGRFALVADSLEAVEAMAARGATPLSVLVECDTGAGRCGVQTPEEARDLALRISDTPGLAFGGLMTYPRPDSAAAVQTFMAAAVEALKPALGECPVISSGGTPGVGEAGAAHIVTEYRAGSYIYNDRALMARGDCREADCALTVLTSVLSRARQGRAIIDAGSKSLTSDLQGLTGFGAVLGLPGAEIELLSEEHGHVALNGARLNPGEKLQVIPNHACPVSNLFDRVYLHRAGTLERDARVAARGCVV